MSEKPMSLLPTNPPSQELEISDSVVIDSSALTTEEYIRLMREQQKERAQQRAQSQGE